MNNSDDELVAEVAPEPLYSAEVFGTDCLGCLYLAGDDLAGL